MMEYLKSFKQDKKLPFLSEGYTPVNTNDIIMELQENGWYVSSMKETKTQYLDGYQKHMVRFREISPKSIILNETIFPEIVLINSHDGSTSFQLHVGLFRLVCKNGMIVSNGELFDFRFSHLLKNIKKLISETLYHLLTYKIPYLTKKVESYQSLILDDEMRISFAKKALKLKGVDLDRVDYDLLLKPKRLEDREPTLWNTFSIIQEKFVNGGGYTTNSKGRVVWSRGINSIQNNYQLNQDLWDLMDRTQQKMLQ